MNSATMHVRVNGRVMHPPFKEKCRRPAATNRSHGQATLQVVATISMTVFWDGKPSREALSAKEFIGKIASDSR